MNGHAVATPHHLSAEAGRTILEAGGNAVDAAIAAVAAQGVVAPETCGIGGDLFALIHRPGWDQPMALNASGRAGSRVNAARIREEGFDEMPDEVDHPSVVTVPGCVDGLSALSSELGKLTLGDDLAPAIALAHNGFMVSTEQAGAFSRLVEKFGTNPAMADFYPDGSPIKRGDMVTRRDLARTLGAIATEGRDAFYKGRPAEDISEAVDGLITMDDLAREQAEWVNPIGVEVAGLMAWAPPPNSQGFLGPGTLAVFAMLDPPDDPDDPLWWHLLIEAYRCLAWERDDIVAEASTAPLPEELVLEKNRLLRAAETVSAVQSGQWPAVGSLSDTAYLCVADADGMAVSVHQSNYSGIGSHFGARRSGFVLQDRGSGFNLTPGHPNELGPGKRPLHTLSPTLWTEGKEPRYIMGTRGGDIQPQLVAQIAARTIIGPSGLEGAQSAPRWSMADFGPGSASKVSLEPGVPTSVVADLTAKGHQIEQLDELQGRWGPLSIVELDGNSRTAAADPRVDTTTAVVF